MLVSDSNFVKLNVYHLIAGRKEQAPNTPALTSVDVAQLESVREEWSKLSVTEKKKFKLDHAAWSEDKKIPACRYGNIAATDAINTLNFCAGVVCNISGHNIPNSHHIYS